MQEEWSSKNIYIYIYTQKHKRKKTVYRYEGVYQKKKCIGKKGI